MLFRDPRRARSEAMERAQELERLQQRRASAFKVLLSDICRFKLCILAAYPTDPTIIEIRPERIEAFSNIRTDINQDLQTLRETGIEIPEKVQNVINGVAISDFTSLDDCNTYFEKLESALRTIIMYY